MYNNIVAQTEHTTIWKEYRNGKTVYKAMVHDMSVDVFETKHDAFDFLYKELLEAKKTDYFKEHLTY